MGRYISPTIFDYRERIQVNEKYITKEAVARLAEMVEAAMAFLYFKKMNCDLVVLECGMGGLTDATNVVKTTVVSVFAEIGMDHMGFLGNTVEEIAGVKARIIMPGTIVVSAE